MDIRLIFLNCFYLMYKVYFGIGKHSEGCFDGEGYGG